MKFTIKKLVNLTAANNILLPLALFSDSHMQKAYAHEMFYANQCVKCVKSGVMLTELLITLDFPIPIIKVVR